MEKKTWLYICSTVAALAFYAGAKNYKTVRKAEDFLAKEKIPVAEESFDDPKALEILIEPNKNGRMEVYLHHITTGRKVAIGYDMLPKSAADLARGLESRLDKTK